MSSLRLDWCSHQAAKYAVQHWHYSKSLPRGGSVKVGVWEDNQFIGCIIFSKGATPHLGAPYGLTQFECCEMTRVALSKHKAPVSRIISIAVKWLQKQCPGIRLIVSFADPSEGHYGGIYQAGNWLFCGITQPATFYIIKGKKTHPRTIGTKGLPQTMQGARTIDPNATAIECPGKYRYAMPLDGEMRKQIAPLAKPYPKRPKEPESKPMGRGRCDSDPDAPELTNHGPTDKANP